ncbi:MAG TPA: triple tyrosine motif-containing protein [Cytophagaceae bacterium]|nr:triple tyrosine motif-containing protein [Cytophagaceae bacterium]
MYKRILSLFFLVLLFLIVQNSLAQSGDYYLKHFNIELPNIDNDNYAITQDGQGRMHIANRQGVLRFDGTFWSITPTPGTVLSVKYDPITDLIYVGCINDYGYIRTDATGREIYISLSRGDVFAKNIAKIEVFENFVYFLGEDVLFEFSKREQKVLHSYKDHVVNFFSYNKNIYACYDNHTISKLAIKKFNEQYFGNIPPADIIFSTQLSKTTNVVGTIDNKLYTLSGNYFTEIKLKDAAYIEHCELLDAVAMDDRTVVIATTKGGCLVVNIVTGETKSIINYYSGLPDNEVYAIGKDISGGVWIAHEFGVTRLDYNLPYRCYSNYLGLEGHLETAITFNGKLYVGTNEGIFMLDETKLYKEIPEIKKENKKVTTVKTVKVQKKAAATKPPSNKNNPPTKTTATDKETKATAPAKKERFKIRDFFKKKNKSDTSETSAKTTEKRAGDKKAKNYFFKKIYVTKYRPSESQSKKYVLESIKHSFKKVAVGDLKCLQLTIINGRLLAATNSGIYDINGLTATRLCEDNIRYLYASKFSNKIFASTSHGEVLTFGFSNDKWNKIELFGFIKQPITYIAEDKKKNLWLSGIDQVYRFTIDDSSNIQDIYEQEIKNPYSDDIFITNLNNQIYFSLSSTYYYFDYNSNKLIRDTITENKFKHSDRILNSQSDILWILKNKFWQYLSDKVKNNENFVYLSLFKNVDEMILDEKSSAVWVITSDNKLYNLSLRKNYNILSQPKVFVNDVKNGRGEYLSISNFSVQQTESNLHMDIISADYYDQNALEYQYKIVGLNDHWSAWSTNNTIILNYLASGKYKILIRSRNALGQITEKEALNFKIKPPYWQTWWFYLIEMIVFGSLWILSFRLNRTNYSNQIIRKLLTFLTLVITVEFMSTVAENMININISPVVDFLVKVGIAIILFPFEQLLMKFIGKK